MARAPVDAVRCLVHVAGSRWAKAMRTAVSWDVFHRTTAVGVYEPELMTAYRLESWAATMDALRRV
jgi:hypothetical protein